MVCERQQSQIPESENPTGGCLSSKINACRRQRTSPFPSRTSSLMTRYPLPPLYPRRNQPSSLACPPLAAIPPLAPSFVRIPLRISGYTNAVGHARPRFNPPLPFPAALRFLFPFPFPLSPSLFHLHKDTANSPRANKLYYFYQGFHLERT